MSSHLISLSLLAIISSDSVRDSLERTSEFWFVCLSISSAGVAIGCLLEIGETWSDFKKWLAARKDPEANEEDKSWHKPIAAIGLLLVILGVVGEGVFEAKLSNADTELRAHDEKVLGETIIQAGEAKDSAKAAATDATIAKGASADAVTASGNALTLATGARKEADSFEADIVSAKTLAASAESHLADALQRAAKAELDSAKAQLELARLTAPIQSVPVINGVATPDPTKGLRLRILLHSDVRIKLPTLPKGKSITWSLFIVQDEKGDHQFSTFPHDLMFGNFLFHPPHSFCTMELVTDEYGTTDLTFGAASCPSNATDPTITK